MGKCLPLCPVLLQATTATAPTTFNLLSVNGGGQDMLSIRGDGLTTVYGNMNIGTSLSDQVTINSIIQGSTPFVLEGG